MVKPTPPFVSHCLELLQPLGAVRAKRMFGGWGVYADEVFIAVIGDERLFLKVSAESRPAFEAAGCEPFDFDVKNGSIAMSYWSAPADAMDCAALMAPWARRAMAAALLARAVKPRRAARAPSAPSAPSEPPALLRAKPAPKKPSGRA